MNVCITSKYKVLNVFSIDSVVIRGANRRRRVCYIWTITHSDWENSDPSLKLEKQVSSFVEALRKAIFSCYGKYGISFSRNFLRLELAS
jgi:hypothetical protein